jgi:hypothetical protein
MSVKYVCRCCAAMVGEIKDDHINELRLGFHFLTPEERRDIISYSQDGDVTVKIICDYCTEAIEANPELSLLTSPLQ